jgi:hypothetical protein
LSAYDADSPERHVVKVVIPNKLRAFILSELKYMNITRASLFPGIDGFAQSLAHEILFIEDNSRIEARVEKGTKYGIPFI